MILRYMAYLPIVMVGFALPLVSACAQEKSEWFVCEQDADCIAVGAACAVGAVNKAYQDEAHSYYMGLNARMDCATVLKASDLTAECRENKCELIMSKEQVSAHD